MARFDRAVPPGGEGKITLKMKTAKYHGKILKTAKVFSNDPDRPRVDIGLRGEVWAPVVVTPQWVKLNGVVGDPIENAVSLRGQEQEPLIIELASVSIPDKVDVHLNEVEKGKSYELKLRNKVQGEARYAGDVKLTTSCSDKPEIVIRVTGTIRPLLQASPKAVSFGRVTEERLQALKNGSMAMRRPVLVVLNKGNDLRIDKAELEKSLFRVVSIRPLKTGTTMQLQIEAILDNLEKGMNVDYLRIHTNHGNGKVLEVPVRFEIL